VWAAAAFGAALLAAVADAAHPPLPTPCIAGACGAAAPSFVQYGKAAATVSGTTMNVNQSSAQAILNWADFNIAHGYTVNFHQPSATAAALNEIWSASPSTIAGALNANGQVYLINQNGIVFDKGAQVDVGGLVASTLNIAPVSTSTDPYALFKNGLLSNNSNLTANGTPPPVFGAVPGTSAAGSVTVNPGATLTTSEGGRIMLLGSAVTNGGTVTTPGGQAIMAAGGAVYLAASNDPSLRGLLIEVDSGGAVVNQGQISAPRGNVTLAGLIVKQAGEVSATTSVSQNGSIFLVAGDTSNPSSPGFTDPSAQGFGGLLPNQGGNLLLAAGSVTQVLPDASSSATISQANLPNFIPSEVALVGQTVSLQGSASVRAPGATVQVNAAANPVQQFSDNGVAFNDGGRIYLDSGSSIDVSGLTNVPVPATNELVQVTLESIDLQNDPLLRTGFLHGAKVIVNASQGSTLFNVAPYTGNIPLGIDQILTTGGAIQLNSNGDVIARAGSTLNVSGGSVAFQGGNGPSTSKLIAANGKVYDISNAPNTVEYVGFANSYSYTDPTWGTTTASSTQTYYPGYTQGANAGEVSVLAQQIYLRGTMLGQTVAGILQRNPASLPEGGLLALGCNCAAPGGGGLDLRTPAVEFSNHIADTLGTDFDYPDLGATLPPDLQATTTLSPSLLAQGGFNRLSIYSNGAVTLPAGTDLELAPSGALAFTSVQSINLAGNVVARGGTVSLNTVPINDSDVNSHDITVAAGASIDTSGEWINDSPTVTVTPGTAPLVINGGGVAMSASGNVMLGTDSRIDVSGGGWINGNNVLTPGAAGAITLAAALGVPGTPSTGRVEIGRGVALLGDSLSAGKGGTLSLAAGSVTLGETAAGTNGELLLTPQFFNNRGFGSYNITGQNDVIIGSQSAGAPPVLIDPVEENLVFTQNPFAETTGTSLESFASLQTLPPSRRAPVHISFTSTGTGNAPGTPDSGFVWQGQNATVATDPGGSVSLTAKSNTGNVTELGSLRAPGGHITLQLGAPSFVNSPGGAGFFADQQILLGPHANLDAAGYALVDTLNPLGYRQGTVLPGGSVSLQAYKGFVVTDPGSVIDVRGTAAVLDIVNTNGVTPTTVTGNAGAIAIDAREGLVLQGSLLGQAAAQGGHRLSGAGGGSLTLGIDLFDYVATANNNPNLLFPYPLNARTLTLSAQPASALPTAPQSGVADISAPGIAAGGFDSITLKSADVIAVSGVVSLTTAASLVLDAPVLQGNPGAALRLNSSYVALGNYFNQVDYFDTPGSFGIPVNPNVSAMLTPSCSGSPCTAALAVNAQLIDIRGITGWQGFATQQLTSSGDLRLSIAQSPVTTPPPLETPAGDPSYAPLRAGLNLAAPLTLQAQQVYPTSNTDFTLTSASAVTVLPAAGTAAVPLSAGGLLTINAPTITQEGVLRAPLGWITLQGTGSGGAAQGTVTLASGSVTSVSPQGLTIPFGSTLNGQQWTYAPDSTVTQVFTAPPAKTITLNGADVSVSKGATVDLSGGGDLYAYEWIQGPGGSTDVLAPATGTYQYAIVPALGSQFSALDSQYQQGSAASGNQTIYLSGVPGLAAGSYALLPARYALLPGAYAIEVVKLNSDLAPGSVVQEAAGGYQVAARFGVAGTSTQDSRTSTVFVAPGAVVNTQSQYTSSYANTFFSSAAAASGKATPSLPADAGALQLSATSSLLLDGSINFAPGSFVAGTNASGAPVTVKGNGGDVSIQAPSILVLDSVGAPGAAGGPLELSAQSLSDLGAQTLALGAAVQNTSLGEQVTVGATQAIELDNASVALKAPEIILAAQQQITFDAGAKLDGSGTVSRTPAALVFQGGGALVRASGGTAVPLEIGTSGTTPVGQLSIASGATLQATGDLLLYSTNTTAAPGATIAAPAMGLYSSRISLGDVPSGSEAPPGLNLPSQFLGQLTGLKQLTLGSTSTIDFYGAVDLGTGSSPNAALESLTLDAWAIDGYGSGASTLQAGAISLANSNTGSVPAGLFTTPPSGTGTVTFRAVASSSPGSGQITLAAGSKALNGFSGVTLSADGEIQGQGNGSLVVAGTNNAAVPLSLQAAALTAAGAASQSITTGGAVTITPSAGNVPAPAAPFGGALSIQGSSIAQGGRIDLPAGVLSLTATNGDLVLEQGSLTSVAGASRSFQVTSAVAPGGTISLSANQGNVSVSSGAIVDVSGASSPDGKVHGDAGSLDVFAPLGQFIFAGSTLKGGASPGQQQGNFTLDVGSGLGGAGLDTLDAALSSSGFTGALALRTRSDSQVSLTGTVTASRFELAADQGSIEVSGTIDTSGSSSGFDTNGGSIALWAGSGLTVGAGAQLLANGGAAGPPGANGTAAPAHGGDITLGTVSGYLTINSGTSTAPTTISLSGAGDATTDGTLTLRAPRVSADNDVQINAVGPFVQVNTRRPVVVEGVRTYQATDLGGIDSGCGSGGSCDVADLGGLLFTDAATFAGNAAAIVNRLGLTNNLVQVRPGIEIDSTGDLTVDNTTNPSGVWDLDSWNTALGAPVNVTLRAAGNLIFNASMSDGFTNSGGTPASWTFGESGAIADSGAYRLTAGADLAAANPLAVVPQPMSASSTGGVPNSGNVIVTPGNLIRTGDGNIDIAAGGDVLLGYSFNGYQSDGTLQVAESDPLSAVIYTAGVPLQLTPDQSLLFQPSANAAYPTMGGNITVSASGDIRGAPSVQLVSDWLWRRGQVNAGTLISTDQNASWWVVFSRFEQGIGALGGGNIALNAGGDIVNVSAVIPTTGQLLGAAGSVPSAANVILTGGGQLQVRAGGNISSGLFEDDWGNAAISAGASLNSGTTLGTVLTGLDQTSLAPGLAAAAIYPILVVGEGSFDVSARAGADVNLVANSTTLPMTVANSRANHGLAYFYTYGTGSAVNLVSSGGNVVLRNDISNLPIGVLNQRNSSLPQVYVGQTYNIVYPGTLRAAALSGDLGVLATGTSITSGLNLFPSSLGDLDLLAQGYITGSTNRNLTSLVVATMYETDPSTWASIESPTTDTSIVGQLPLTPLHQNDPQAAHLVANTGSISVSELTFPKSADVIAGGSIYDLSYAGKNLNPSDVTLVEAGGNISYSTPTAPITNQVLPNYAGIAVGGPGHVEVLAGGTLNLGDSAGIVTTGSLADARLPQTGASLLVGAGFGSAQGALRWPATDSFIKDYIGPTTAGAPSIYASELVAYMQQLEPGSGTLTYPAALAAFQALTREQQLPFVAQVLNGELNATGLAHTMEGTDYTRGYTAIGTLFPTKDAAGKPLGYQGDIEMFFSQLKTEQGGNINMLAPGGSVVVGVPNPPASLIFIKETFSPFVAAAANLGVLVLGPGAIEGFADQNFEVNTSRMLTLEGGDIILWASNGNIDAGRGAKSASGAPPPVIQTDAAGNVFVNPINDVSGSGIGQLLTGPDEIPGLVNLIAPKGAVNAGEAGIRVAGNLNIAAVQVIGANNIQVSGTATGVPVSEAGALAGALSGANSLADISKSTLEQLSQDVGAAANYQQLTESLTPTFIVVKMFCLGIECEQH
jgi:filamentous hemagglutinin family protein